MSLESKKINPQKTLLTISTGFILLFLILKIKWLLTVALLIGIIGISSDWISKKIDWAWMKLAWILSLIMPNILLTIIFYLILTPIAFLNKLFGKKDPLMLKPQSGSLYRSYQKTFDQAYFEKHW
jgi:hypothetical protein